MSLFIVDVESDGPIPYKYSMICFGAVKVDYELSTTFYGKTKPISDNYVPDALKISGFSRKDHLTFDDPMEVMKNFSEWIMNVNTEGSKPIFISDNLAYDWSFINWYLHYYTGYNPFGYSGRRIGDLWCGYKNDFYIRWKYMRKTKHTHNPVDDAIGNAEALLQMKKDGLKLPIR